MDTGDCRHENPQFRNFCTVHRRYYCKGVRPAEDVEAEAIKLAPSCGAKDAAALLRTIMRMARDGIGEHRGDIALLAEEWAARFEAAAVEQADDHLNAGRWRALLAGDLCLQGSGGMGHTGKPADANGYRHFGMSFTSLPGTPWEGRDMMNARSRTVLVEYTDAILSRVGIPADTTTDALADLRREFADWHVRDFPMMGSDALHQMAMRGLCTQQQCDSAIAEANLLKSSEDTGAGKNGPVK